VRGETQDALDMEPTLGCFPRFAEAAGLSPRNTGAVLPRADTLETSRPLIPACLCSASVWGLSPSMCETVPCVMSMFLGGHR
jgi:hypothetical protein